MDRTTFVTSGISFVVAGVTAQRRPAATATAVARPAAYDPASAIPQHVLRDPLVGEVRRFDGAVAPPGWAFCDGRSLSIAAFPRLFAVLGRSAGGERTTFRLPRTRPGLRAIIAIAGWTPASPAALAAARPGPPGSGGAVPPARSRLELNRVPVAAKYPLYWPGTVPTAAFVVNQERLQRQASTAHKPSRTRD